MSEKRKFVLREQFVWVAWKTFFSPRSTPGGETLIWRSILFWQLGVLCSCCCCLLSRISNPALPAVSCFCECHPVLTVLMVLRYKCWLMNASTNPPFLLHTSTCRLRYRCHKYQKSELLALLNFAVSFNPEVINEVATCSVLSSRQSWSFGSQKMKVDHKTSQGSSCLDFKSYELSKSIIVLRKKSTTFVFLVI